MIHVDTMGTFDRIDRAQLALAMGGHSDDFGRCGPGSSMQFLGNYFTPECRAHDAAVRGNLANGDSRFMAHLKALPQLPAAIGSYVRARTNPGPDDHQGHA